MGNPHAVTRNVPGRPRPLPDDARSRGLAAEVLALAFADDPVARYMDPDPVRRAPAARAIFEAILGAAGGAATVRVASDPIEGAAIWLPPAAADTEEANLLASLSLADAGQLQRTMAAMKALDEVHAATAGGPHWYLIFLGVHPGAQGSGVGSALLAALHAEADQGVLPCHLEAFGASNRAFYERRGYEVVRSSRVTFTSEPVHSMRRLPRPRETLDPVTVRR